MIHYNHVTYLTFIYIIVNELWNFKVRRYFFERPVYFYLTNARMFSSTWQRELQINSSWNYSCIFSTLENVTINSFKEVSIFLHLTGFLSFFSFFFSLPLNYFLPRFFFSVELKEILKKCNKYLKITALKSNLLHLMKFIQCPQKILNPLRKKKRFK